ncbi:hypothetical protein QRF09_09215 [Mycobacterium tuberculosis]|uniref:hypothetical protein n=1 Tax=Mycobacterium tuberculosis TaxID=1773 RepID=UPI00255B46A7|nr:hypothetical protein [Mycobacterium tuberculosis]WIX97623.1 hypothetical protein QRF09_09215 [Mycobacterium tuberculosis]
MVDPVPMWSAGNVVGGLCGVVVAASLPAVVRGRRAYGDAGMIGGDGPIRMPLRCWWIR